MTLRRSVRETLVRGVLPYWSDEPTSGDGAANYGGRFNPIGLKALYLSFDFETAAREVRFALNKTPYTYYFVEVDCEDVADLTDAETLAAFGFDPDDLQSPNWESEMRRGIEPSTHRIARTLIAGGFAGAIVPSFAPGALPGDKNLVLWDWEDAADAAARGPHRVRVLHRDKLPASKASWPKAP